MKKIEFTVQPVACSVRPITYNEDLCIGCGRCAESCPQKIITIAGGKAKIAPRGCISCYCCQEMCPVQAVK